MVQQRIDTLRAQKAARVMSAHVQSEQETEH